MKKSKVQSPKSELGPAIVPRSSLFVLRSSFLVLLLACLMLFCSKPLPSPGLVIQDSPADSAVLRTSVVAFRWQVAERASAYELQTATDSRFTIWLWTTRLRRNP
jgi:hypothetical protein